MKTYVPYHMHTELSLLDSCTKYQDYIDLAVRDGAGALAITEHGTVLNWTEKWDACKKAGIKYIHGVEMYLTRSLEEKVRDNYHTILLAKNYNGLLEINDLVSMSYDSNHFYYKNRISFDEFLVLSDNVITTSACLASPLNKISEDDPYFERLVCKYTYLEIQPHNCIEQINFNKKLYELSQKYNIPLIAGTDTHSSSKYKAECREIFTLANNKFYEDEAGLDLSYKTCEELQDMFLKQGALPEPVFNAAIAETNNMTDLVEDFDLDTSIKYPILYGTRENDDKKYDEALEKKFEEKVSSGIIPSEQVENFRTSMLEETRVFRKLNMTGFMLSMSEFLSWCRSQNFAIGPARGSVGGSRVAYVLDIIDLNPEQWHTVFSRFANEDRLEIGDIDVDCVAEDRPKIFEYIINRFGVEKTARVPSFGTLQDKAAIDEIGRGLARRWYINKYGVNPKDQELNKSRADGNNKWSFKLIDDAKKLFESSPEEAKEKYKDIFYYFDGLVTTKKSQSVHPAGIVVSPITLNNHFGVFEKDGTSCLMLDMENIHDYTGLAKYDFLILKTVTVIRDTCAYLNKKYPRSHEINWDDPKVWQSVHEDCSLIFQFEGDYAAKCLQQFDAKSIFDMSLVTAAIRPSGASYRNDLLQHKIHHNPSKIIDDLLSDNYGYLIYQEDTIKFLQQICGLSGSSADNIRRAIGRKQRDRLEKAMPDILNGYCEKSDKSRMDSEEEAKEFLQIIEDSAYYQFGYNHSIAYCLLGYLCAYLRYYYPLEYITSYLNNAANDDDINNATAYAKKIGVNITIPRFGQSRAGYYFDNDNRTISKGLASIKYMSKDVADQIYSVSHNHKCGTFMEVLWWCTRETSANANQLGVLVSIDFFEKYGNQNELLKIMELYFGLFKKGAAKSIDKTKVDGTVVMDAIKNNSNGVTKAGKPAANYTLLNSQKAMIGSEIAIKDMHMDDVSIGTKIVRFKEATGYLGLTTGKEEDNKKLFVLSVSQLRRKSDKKLFGYAVIAKSIGSGKETRYTVMNPVFKKNPIKENDIIYCDRFVREKGKYFTITQYRKLSF